LEEDFLSLSRFYQNGDQQYVVGLFSPWQRFRRWLPVRELGAVQGTQTRNLRALIRVKERAASATGTRP